MPEPKYIEVRGKKYLLNDDIEYKFIREFQEILKSYNADTLEDPDVVLISTLRDAICPSLPINTENMTIGKDKKGLMFSEVKKLVIDLRSGLEDIMSSQIDSLLNKDKGIAVKNAVEAIEGHKVSG